MPAIELAFDASALAKARDAAADYRVVLEPADSGGFTGWCLEMPGVLAEGATPEACLAETYDGIAETIATMLERGKQPPQPYSQREIRSAQINLRVTPEEKLVLEEAGRQQGFKAVSDYIRTTALRESRRKRTA